MMGHPRYWRFAIFTQEIRSQKKKKGKKNDEDVIAEKNKQENVYEPPKIDLEQSDWSCVNHALSNAVELAIRTTTTGPVLPRRLFVTCIRFFVCCTKNK